MGVSSVCLGAAVALPRSHRSAGCDARATSADQTRMDFSAGDAAHCEWNLDVHRDSRNPVIPANAVLGRHRVGRIG